MSRKKNERTIMEVNLPKGSIRQPKSSNPSPSKGLIRATS